MSEDFDADWTQLAGKVLSGIKEWRLQHPKATLTEIETVLDQRWAVARAKFMQDMALASEPLTSERPPRAASVPIVATPYSRADCTSAK